MRFIITTLHHPLCRLQAAVRVHIYSCYFTAYLKKKKKVCCAFVKVFCCISGLCTSALDLPPDLCRPFILHSVCFAVTRSSFVFPNDAACFALLNFFFLMFTPLWILQLPWTLCELFYSSALSLYFITLSFTGPCMLSFILNHVQPFETKSSRQANSSRRETKHLREIGCTQIWFEAGHWIIIASKHFNISFLIHL